MKLALLAALLGTATVSAAEHVTLRGAPAASEFVYAPPPATESTDLASLWDELAAEASLMQVQIGEGRTYQQCTRACDKSNDVNRKRCRRNCKEIKDKGNDSKTRTFSCSDCRRSFNEGSRKEERCLESCRNDQSDSVQKCKDADSCGRCRQYCGSGRALDKCLDREGCSSAEDRRSDRDCDDARNCGNCNAFCDKKNDLKKCRKEYCSAEDLLEGAWAQ